MECRWYTNTRAIRNPDPLSTPCGGRCHGVTEGGSARQRPAACGQWGGTPPQPAAAPPARGGAGSGSPLHPLRGEMSRSDRGGVGATAPLRVRAVGRDPPSACGSSPRKGRSGIRIPSPPLRSTPCGGRCHAVTEGGSARQRPSACGEWGGTPLSLRQLPPQGGERGITYSSALRIISSTASMSLNTLSLVIRITRNPSAAR